MPVTHLLDKLGVEALAQAALSGTLHSLWHTDALPGRRLGNLRGSVVLTAPRSHVPLLKGGLEGDAETPPLQPRTKALLSFFLYSAAIG